MLSPLEEALLPHHSFNLSRWFAVQLDTALGVGCLFADFNVSCVEYLSVMLALTIGTNSILPYERVRIVGCWYWCGVRKYSISVVFNVSYPIIRSLARFLEINRFQVRLSHSSFRLGNREVFSFFTRPMSVIIRMALFEVLRFAQYSLFCFVWVLWELVVFGLVF